MQSQEYAASAHPPPLQTSILGPLTNDRALPGHPEIHGIEWSSSTSALENKIFCFPPNTKRELKGGVEAVNTSTGTEGIGFDSR